MVIIKKVPEGRRLSKLEPEVECRRQRASFEFRIGTGVKSAICRPCIELPNEHASEAFSIQYTARWKNCRRGIGVNCLIDDSWKKMNIDDGKCVRFHAAGRGRESVRRTWAIRDSHAECA